MREMNLELTPLIFELIGIGAIFAGSDEGNKQAILELLQAPNIQVNVQDDQFKETPLHLAVKYTKSDMREIIRMLINKGANPNIQDRDGKTPLHDAVNSKNLAAVQERIKSAWNEV